MATSTKPRRIAAILWSWARVGYARVDEQRARWVWTEKGKKELSPVLTALTPKQAARGVDDGSLGVTM